MGRLGGIVKLFPDRWRMEKDPVSSTIKDFCTRTSCHGVSRLYEAVTLRLRTEMKVYAVVMLAAFVGIVFCLHGTFQTFLSTPTVTSVLNSAIYELPIPSVTVCQVRENDLLFLSLSNDVNSLRLELYHSNSKSVTACPTIWSTIFSPYLFRETGCRSTNTKRSK